MKTKYYIYKDVDWVMYKIINYLIQVIIFVLFNLLCYFIFGFIVYFIRGGLVWVNAQVMLDNLLIMDYIVGVVLVSKKWIFILKILKLNILTNEKKWYNIYTR